MLFGKKAPSNLLDLLDARAAQMAARDAYKFPIDTGWGSMTWSQVASRVYALAAYLVDIGIMPGDRVAIMSPSRIEWPLSCLAILAAGATAVPIYPETNSEEVTHILSDSGTSMLFVDIPERLEVIYRNNDAARTLPVVVYEGSTPDHSTLFADAHGSEVGSREVTNRLVEITGDTLATLLYTSGTTGKPKGVMLTHGNWLAEALAIAETRIVDEKDVEYYWLPFAHSFGMALMFGHLAIGFLKFVDGNPAHIAANLKQIKPTFMGGPPRTFEKIAAGVAERMTQETRVTRFLYQLALNRAELRNGARQRTGRQFRPPKVGIAALVFGKLSQEFGGRLRFFISGGAPLSSHLAEQFDYWGVPILQGYGLTETCGASLVGRYHDHPVGSVGWPLPSTDVRIALPVDGRVDGEILLRGPHIMRGYYHNPEATTEVIDADGWFHTGDLGRRELRPDGRTILYVTGRLKQACKLSTGKYVIPERLEVELTATGLIAHAVVVAEGRKFVSALVSLDPDNLRQWADRHGIKGDYVQLATSAAVEAEIRRLVEDINTHLNNWERIGEVRVIPEVFAAENGYLTPSNKVVRHRVFSVFDALIEDIYG